MLTQRVIACLDVKDGRVVKGTGFVNLRDAGDPVVLAERYETQGADEIVYLDISATDEARGTLLDLVRRTAERLFIPLTVGGGMRTVDDIAQALRAGGPWGQSFPEPSFDGVFAIRNARVVGDRHLKMWVEVPKTGRSFDAIAFNHIEERASFVPPEGSVQLVYRLDVNEYQGERRLQLLVDHVLPAHSATTL